MFTANQHSTTTPDGATLPPRGGCAFGTEPLEPGAVVLTGTGELDAAAVPELRELLHAAVEAGITRLVLDFSGVSFMDSLALATVVGAQRRLGERGRLTLVAQHPYVLLILEATGLDRVLEVCRTREDGEASVTRTRAPGPPELVTESPAGTRRAAD